MEWSKRQVVSLKHDVKSCPQRHEAELNEQLDKLSERLNA